MTSKHSLIQRLNEADADILGYLCWWSFENISIPRNDFIELIKQVELDESSAREHNYRSSLLRALKELEEQRIIRKVDENDDQLVFQFTAEVRVEDGDTPSFDYQRETIVVVDKNIYRQKQSFGEALVKGDDAIRERLVRLFYEEQQRYKSADVTRYVQRMFKKRADFISLRKQGSVYFVPAVHRDVIDQVNALVTMLSERPNSSASFEFVPLVDAPSSQAMIQRAFKDEIESIYDAMDDEITELQNGKEVTDRWMQTRLDQIVKLGQRIELYKDTLNDGMVEQMKTNFSKLEAVILGQRKLSAD